MMMMMMMMMIIIIIIIITICITIILMLKLRECRRDVFYCTIETCLFLLRISILWLKRSDKSRMVTVTLPARLVIFRLIPLSILNHLQFDKVASDKLMRWTGTIQVSVLCQTKSFALSATFDEKCEAVRSKSEISLRENTGTPPVCMSACITEQ